MIKLNSIQKQTISSLHNSSLRQHTIAMIVVEQLGIYNEAFITEIDNMFRFNQFDSNKVILV